MFFLNPLDNPMTNGGNQHLWDRLRQACIDQGGAAHAASGAAAGFSQSARQEAASKLISNHLHVLRDVCNSTPGTQTHRSGALGPSRCRSSTSTDRAQPCSTAAHASESAAHMLGAAEWTRTRRSPLLNIAAAAPSGSPEPGRHAAR